MVNVEPMRNRKHPFTMNTWLGLGALVTACSDGPAEATVAPRCLAGAPSVDCSPLYLPAEGDAYSFSDIFENGIQAQACNSGPCHDASNPTGGLDMSTEEVAYDNLLDATLDPPRVVPGDVHCGKLIVYLETPDEPYSMPPGAPLSEPELCVFRKWIASGAEP